MTTTLDYEQVTAFAKAVRRELVDLGPDTLDELTDGLEADLADKLADGEALGDPGAYAAELRDAAGVEPRTTRSHLREFRENLSDLRARLAPIAAHPMVSTIIAFVVSLRPLWWVLRAWGLFLIFTGSGYPRNELGAVFLIALVLLSVQWGRDKLLPWRWSRAGVGVVSVIAILALPVAAGSLYAAVTYQETLVPEDFVSGGLLNNGSTVTNIFAYGADGKPLTDVQLFDQNGNPLAASSEQWGNTTIYDETIGDSAVLVPSDEVAGRPGWNVYPLQSVSYDSLNFDTGEVNSWAKRSDVSPPFATVQQLLGYEAPEPETDDE